MPLDIQDPYYWGDLPLRITLGSRHVQDDALRTARGHATQGERPMYAIQPFAGMPGVPPTLEPADENEEKCTLCRILISQWKQAREENNPSREVDARVKYRLHAREFHGRTVPLFVE